MSDGMGVLLLFLTILSVVVAVGEVRRRRCKGRWRGWWQGWYRERSRDAYQALQDGRFDDAAAQLSGILVEFPRDGWSLAMRGVCCLQSDDVDGAIDYYTRAVHCGWSEAGTYIELAYAQLRKSNFDEAIVCATKGLALCPDDPDGRRFRGRAYLEKGLLPEALADLSHALLYAPDDAQSLLLRAGCRYLLGELDSAVADATESIRLRPDSPDAYCYRASALHQTAEYAAALADARHVLESEPTEPSMLNLVAWIGATCPLAEFRNGNEAVALAQRACELTGFRDGHFLDTLAAAHAEVGNFDEAIRIEAEARRVGPAEFHEECDRRTALYRERQSLRDTRPTPTRSPHQ